MAELTTPEAQSSPAPKPAAGWLLLVRLLLAIAIAGAGFLAWVSFHNGPVVGCGTASGCNKVLQSRWAYWLDIPVSVPALLVYLGLLGATVLLPRRPSPDDQRGSWAAIITLSIIVAGAAIWFIGLQVFVIHAFCKFCMTAHACGLAAALICLGHIPFAKDPDTPMWTAGSGKVGVPRSGVALLAAIGLAGVAVLAGGQMLVQKERNVVKVLGPGGTQARSGGAKAAAGTAPGAGAGAQLYGLPGPNPRLVEPRVLSLYSNQFVLKLDTLPMMGSPDASNILVCLFDYTCPHCRALHPILLQTQRLFGNQLGVVCLPMPISTNCDRLLTAAIYSVPNACEYAELGLAVWRANPGEFRAFDDWMFAPARPPPLEQARQYAAGLVGKDKLEAALSDPWVQQQIATDCQMHYANWQAAENPIMPQLIVGPTISSGPLNSVEHLEILLSRYLGIAPPRGKP
ncbi:MAG TPA: vitamin K epoxide reductase family protein [Candidatus Acidoferrum sp.]|nr:vitamin K epoxide reductase family protein [Candidatus Acidoferrum sp.]